MDAVRPSYYNVQNKCNQPKEVTLVMDGKKVSIPLTKSNKEYFFIGRDLSGANLNGLDLSGVNFTDAKLDNANVKGTNFTGAVFNRTSVVGIITGADTNFSQCSISNVDFTNSVLNGINFSETTFNDVLFCNAFLDKSNFKNAIIDKCNFENANLRFSKFKPFSLSNTSFDNAKLNNTNIHGLLTKDLTDVSWAGIDVNNITKEWNAATPFQKIIRGFNVRHPEPLQGGELPVMKFATDGAPAAVYLNEKWHRVPNELPTSGESGKDKKLTHGGQGDSVVLLKLNNPLAFVPAQKEFVDFCLEKNLTSIINQRRFSISKVVAPNAGLMEQKQLDKLKELKFKKLDQMTPEELELWNSKDKAPLNFKQLIASGKYTLDIDHFRPFFSDLDAMHEAGFVHRDIKSANCILRDGYICSIDNDSVGKQKTFPKGQYFHTELYVHQLLRLSGTDDDNTNPEQVLARDNYAAFMMMMEAFYGEPPNAQGRYSVPGINKFVDNALPCSQELKDDLKAFLNNPRDKPLKNKSLSAYI